MQEMLHFFSNLDNGMVQYIRDVNGAIDGVDLLACFTMNELKGHLNMVYVAGCSILCRGRCQ